MHGINIIHDYHILRYYTCADDSNMCLLYELYQNILRYIILNMTFYIYKDYY